MYVGQRDGAGYGTQMAATIEARNRAVDVSAERVHSTAMASSFHNFAVFSLNEATREGALQARIDKKLSS